MKPEELKSLLRSWVEKKPDWLQLSTYNLLIAAVVVLSALTLSAISTLLSSSPEVSARAAAKDQRLVYDIAADKIVKGGSVKEFVEAKNEGEPAQLEILDDAIKKAEVKSEKETVEQSEGPSPETDKTEEASSDEHPGSEAPADSGKTASEHGKARIAMIITGVGISKSSSDAVNNLPPAISIAISPYSHFADAVINAAAAAKREYLVEIPSEPKDYPITDPGPYSLLCENQLVENLSHVEWAMGRVKKAVAAALPIDEKFSQCTESAGGVFAKLAEMETKLLISTPDIGEPDSIKSSGVKSLRADVVVDSSIDLNAIDSNLAELEKTAMEKGLAIGIARPYPISIKAVSKWSESLSAKGIELVPATTAFEDN